MLVENVAEIANDSDSGEKLVNYAVGEYAAVAYDDHWYIGKVIHATDQEGDTEFLCMRRSRGLWQWPSPAPDTVWRTRSQILCKISSPVPTGKSKRMFKITADDKARVEARFAAQ